MSIHNIYFCGKIRTFICISLLTGVITNMHADLRLSVCLFELRFNFSHVVMVSGCEGRI